jgi:hypothetical protein
VLSPISWYDEPLLMPIADGWVRSGVVNASGGGLGFIGVGGGSTDGDDEIWSAFYSLDGIDWTVTPLPGEDPAARGIWVADDALIAGCVKCRTEPIQSPRGTVWRSTDGANWEPTQLKGSSNITAALKFQDEYIAVGSLGGDENCAGVGTWITQDATSWGEPNPLPVDSGLCVFPADFIVAGDRLLLLATSRGSEDYPVVAGWTSGDGRDWTPVTVEREGTWYHAAVVGDTVVALGDGYTVPPGDGSVWLSADGGTTFTKQEPALFAFNSDRYFSDVASTGDLIVATQDGGEQGSVLTTTDGVGWQQDTNLPGTAGYRAYFSAVAASSDLGRVVVFGQVRDKPEQDNPWTSLIWTGEVRVDVE